MSSLNLSNSSNNEYFVTIDSEFRDNEKYPIETDFAVKFKTTQSNIPFVKGIPYIQTGSTGPVSNSFFTDIQIDPNYLNSDFRVLNGSILNLKKIDNQFIFCGIIKPFLTNTTSFTFNIQQKINNTYTNLLSKNWSYYFESPYLCKISLIDNSYVFDWIIFIDKYDTNNVNSNYSSNASFSFDSNNNIRFMFDFSLYQIVLNKISQSLTTSLIYNIENPSSVSNSCLAIFAFDINSNIYYVDGHPWGYHILQGNTDLLPTKSNGKNSIKVSDALDIYIGANMNPFEPTYSYPFNTDGTSNMNYVISNRRLFFAFGDGTNNTIAYSTDGINWTGIGKTIFSTSGRSISNNSSFIFVALGEGTNTLAYSYDGINWTGLGSSIFSSVGYDATWKNTGISSPTPYRCVAVGSGTNTIAYSDNGLSWTGIGSSIFSTAGYGIYYSSIQDRFVAVGQGTNTIAYNNYSGNSWWTATNGPFSSSGGYGVAYSSVQNRWVAVGTSNNSILYSTDGISWTGIGSSIFSTRGYSVAYSSTLNRWVAVGEGSTNTIAYSTDGITWTGIGKTIFSSAANSVDYSSTLNRWVAVGQGTNSIAYSTDGITWTGIGTSIFSTAGYGVAYSSTLNRWVAVGNGSTNTIAYSTDGITWTGIGKTIFTTYGIGVSYSSTLNRWVAVGRGTNSIAYSTDGITWTGIGTSIFSVEGRNVAYSSTLNRWVAVGEGSTNTIAYSTDGITWTGIGKTIFSSVGYGVAYSSTLSRWVAVGSGTNIIAYSTDGITWTGVGVFTTRGLNLNYSSTLNRWVAVGIGTNGIMYSTDGIAWTGLGTSIFSTGYAVTYSTALSRWVGVGSGTNTIAYSTDGITWTGIGTSIFSSSGRGIAYSSTQNRWVAVGQGTNTIAYSTDGISWTGIGTSIFSTSGWGVAYSSTQNRWVAVGQGTNSIAYSTDGITWTGIGTSIFTNTFEAGVAYSSIQNRWVAVGSGSNGIAYSTDGITWTGLGTSILAVGRNVAYSSKQNQWIAVGQNTNTIAYSNDGITWYGMGNTLFSVGYGVAYSSTQDKWIVTGDGNNNFAYSSYGINFTGIGTSIFSTAGYGISGTNRTTGSEVYVAVGQGSTNTIATSSDGISWNGRGITVFTTAGRGVGYDSTTDRWIVVGEGGASIGYNSGSSSGLPTFSRVNNSLSIFTVGYSVAKNDNIWVALGSGPNTLAYSFDGLTWYGLGNTIFSNIGYGVTFTGTTTNVQTINIYEDSFIDKLLVFHQNNDLINGPIYGSIILYNNLQNNQLTYSSYNSKNYLGDINALGGTISTYLDNNNIYKYGSTVYMLSKLNNIAGSYSNKMYFCLSSINISTGVFTPDTKVSSEYNNSYNNYSSILYNNFLIIAFVRHDGTYTTQYLQIVYIDLTNIAAGFISLTTSSNFSQTFPYNDAVIDMIEISNVVYICITQKTGDILIYKATLTTGPLAMTFVMSSPYPLYSNSLIVNASLYLLNINCKFIYRNTNLYLVLGIPSVKYYIYGDLILNNLTLQSILDSLKSNIPSQVIYYNKASNYYLLDQLGDIYNINDINNPILIYNNYPTLDRITLSKTIYTISSQYDKEFGNLIDTTKTYDNSYLMNFPFLQDSNDLNSIHYNQNVENQINNSNFITFDIINQQSSVTSSIPTNTYEPSISITDSSVLPIIWFDASNTGSFELSETGTNDYIIKWNNSINNSYNFHLCSSGPTGAVYDYKNSEVILNNTYMEGIFGSSEEIEPKYMIVVSKKWNDLTIDDNLNCLVEIGNPSDKLGFYKYRNYNKNSRSLIASVPPTSQTYSFTGSSNSLLTDTGIHPYLYYENYNVNYNTSSTTKYLVNCGTGTNGLKYSSDGINWIENPVNSFTLTTDAAWNNTTCIIGGAGSQSLAYSTNGITFLQAGPTTTFSTSGRGVSYSSTLNRWISVGQGTNSILYSSDGIIWSGLGTSIFSTAGFGVAYSSTQNRWIAVGQGTNTIAYSTDGITWTGIGTSIFSTAGLGVAYSSTQNRWIAVGQGTNTIAYSTDGITWTNTAAFFSSFGSNAAYSSTLNRWVAVGQGNNSILYSTNGISWTGIGSSIFSTAGYGVAYSSTLNRWVAVGQGTNSIAYSTDGITWTGIGTSIFSTIGRGVAYSSTLNSWVAVGEGTNTIAYSTDGITWTGLGTSIFSIRGRGVAYSSTLNSWVAVGEGTNSIAYSTDGITWTGIGTSIFSITGTGVDYSSTLSRWVAVGQGTNSIAYSTDGITWTGIGTSIFSSYGLGVAYSSTLNRWVAVGEGTNTIAYSTDGITWTGIGTSIFSTRGRGIAYSSSLNRWIAIGEGTNTIAYSTDGISWTPNAIFSANGRGVDYSSTLNRWVAVGSGTNTILYSTDGITWNGIGTSIFTTIGYGVTYSSTLSRWVAVGSGTSTIAYSTDGITWTGNSIFSNAGYGVAYSSTLNRWVAVGEGTNTIVYSTDGITWTGIGTSIFSSAGFGVTYSSSQNKWVAVGSGTNVIVYSSDGINWNRVNGSLINNICYSIYYDTFNDLFLCGGNGTNNTIVATYNPTNSSTNFWYQGGTLSLSTCRKIKSNSIKTIAVGEGSNNLGIISTNNTSYTNFISLGNTSTFTNGIGITYSSTLNRWVAVGSGTNTIAYSTNGINWNGIGTSIYTEINEVYGISYSSTLNRWVAVGFGLSGGINTIAYSTDGIAWTGIGKTIFSSIGYGVAYSSTLNRWVAVGNGTNTIAYSTDGIAWTGIGTSIFTTIGYGVAYSSTLNRWVAVGSGTNTIAYSTDGITWTGIGTSIFSSSGRGIAYSSTLNRWVAVGSGTNTIAYSTDGITWTGIGTSIFTTIGYGVAYSSTQNQWIAVGSGTNTIGYSTDGIVWTGIGTSIFSTRGNGVSYSSTQNQWIAVGFGRNNIAYSTDGISWTGIKSNTFITNSGTCIGVSFSNEQNQFISVGGSINSFNTIGYSTDGITWTGLGTSIFSFSGSGVAYSSILNRWVGVGSGTNTIAYSTDGITWTGIGTSIFSITGTGVAYSSALNRWVAVGQGTNSIAYSTDGITWTGIGTSIFSITGTGVAYSSALNRWVGVGQGTNTIAYSTDGITWTGIGTSIFSTVGRGIAYSEIQNAFVAVGQGGGGNNTIAYSTNGITWTGLGTSIISNAGYGVAYSSIQNKWIVVGDGSLSDIAVSLKLDFTLYNLTFMNSIYDIIYIPSYSRWIIVGSGNSSIAYSDDEGLTWNALGKVYFDTACYSIDYNPYLNLIIACGIGNNYKLAYSYNGIDWTPISFILFDISCNNIKYNNIYNVWYLSGSNSNSLTSTIAYSYDGLNWNYSSNNTKIYTPSSGFAIPLQNYPEPYNKGIYELVYETQSNYSTFDGKFNFNNTNSNNDPVNSSGWNNVLTHLRVGKTSLPNTISKETVDFDEYTNQIIYVNGSTGSTGTIGNFSGTISEIIVYETVPDDTTKKQIQAYLAKKYNLWNVYGGVNPYKPDINYTTNMITVDGVNNTFNFLNINDISNINNYTLPISLFPRSSSLYSNIMSHGDIIDFKHIVYNNNIYLFILFTRATSSSSYIRYLVLYEFDLYYSLKYSTTIYTAITTGASNLSPFPVNNVNVASKFFIPYIKNNNVLVAVNTTSSIIQIYSYIPNSYSSSTLLGSITLNLNIAPYNGFLSAAEIINYGGTYIFYGIATVSNYPYTLNKPGLIGNLITYNITNETSPIELENSLPLLTLTIGTNRNGLKFFKYTDGLKYLFIRQTSGQDQTTVIDISDYNNLSYKNIIGWRHVPEFDYTNTTYIASFPNSDFEVPNSIYQNPVTKHIYMLSNYISETGSNLPTTSNLYNFFSYRNITDLNDIQNSSPIPITPTNLGYRIGSIKHSYSGQKVFAAALVTDNSTINSQYIKFYDVSNVEYASTYYQNNNPFPESITYPYGGLNGLGLGFIHKLSYKGDPQWLNYVGGDSTIYPSTNVNISNIDLNTDSSKLYLTGGWNNKIEAFNKDFTKVNQIYNINSGYNGFVGKITLDKGDYEWIVPSIGDNDDFYEKLSYIPSKDDICVITHFESTTLLVYEPQNSSTGPFTNPSVVNLTLSNSSSESSSLISFNPSGTINYHTSIYSLLEAQSVKLYDLIYDEDTTKKRIYVIGTSNATLINSKDSTNLETQKLYNDIDQNNENSIIIYEYDLNGIYQSSQRITFPPDVVINVSDIKSFSLLNRIITFINLYSTNGTTTDTINIYNPDGTIGVKLVSSIDFVDNLNESLVVQYYYDNTFVDTNGNNYSRIIVLNPNLPTTENSLVNYNLFILGDLFDSTLYNETTQSLQSVSSLNKNFSIRSNFVNPTGNDYNIILNQLIDLTSLERKNLPNDDYWSGSVVKSTLTNIIAYDITLLPNVSNQLTITNIYGEPLDLTKQYYLIIPNNQNITYVTVNSITYNSSSNTYFLNIDNLNDLLVNGQYYGPYVYLSTTNLNANYIIQFCPTPLNSESKFKIKLNSLIIPNRRIRNSYLGGSRDLNDFRYLVLEIYNENDVETYPDTINNNNFYNNPNYIGVSNRSIGSFTIPITGINVSSTSNFILLTSNDTPIVIFRPGFYNIHMKLKDLYGNVVQFDSTPEGNKPSDNIFINTTVDSPLLQIAANFTFVKV